MTRPPTDPAAAVGVAASELVGIDFGGSGIKGAPVDLDDGAFTRDRIRIPTPDPATPDAVAEVVARLAREIGGVGPLGVAMPAVVRRGIALTAANIDDAWIGTDAVELFRNATGRSVAVVNDADAAGAAEMRFGAGRGVEGVVLMVTLGTGIGSALFVDGGLVPNTELGHLPLHGGVAEDYAASSVRDEKGLSMKKYAHRLEKYLELVEGLLWPDLILIGGGISKRADEFLPHVQIQTPVRAAELRNDAGIIGAALLAGAR